MTDTSDYSATTQDATMLLGSGLQNAVGGSFTLAAANIPSTVRSLLVLILITAVHGPGETYTIPIAVGNNSLQQYRAIGVGQGWVPSGAGGGILGPNVPMTPLLFPFYGLVDTSVSIQWVANAGGAGDQVQYWILGLPDKDLAGSDLNPISVTCAFNAANGVIVPVPVQLWNPDGVDQPGTANHPFIVELQDGAGNQQGTVAAPLHDQVALSAASASTGGTALTAAIQKILTAPAAGKLRIVDSVAIDSATAADLIFLTLDGASPALQQQYEPGAAVFHPRWILNSGSYGVGARNTTAARGNATISYHDENA